MLDLFAVAANAHRESVEGKLHSIYFPEYFGKLQTKTIVVERSYVDRDYLEDFVGYYSRCFNPPLQRCTRLHFFQSEFTEDEFDSFLSGSANRTDFLEQKANNGSYLGFIVVKPLAQTFIGRTCLRTYPTGTSGRHFPSLRTYDVNLFGIQLAVNSLAYQEQDAEVARCATAALWSAFQGTAKKYGHPVPTPVEITKNALAVHSYQSRTLPAKDGLTLEQMGDAIRKINLEPYFTDVTDRTHLQTEAYAYLKAGIPALLVISLVDTKDEMKVALPKGEFYGRHAVALTGYNLSNQPAVPVGSTSITLRATKIAKFYAHDDQIGPFARMELSASGQQYQWLDERSREQNTCFMKTSWWGRSEELGSVYAVPETLIVPLYPKMRVTFKEALGATKEFDSAIASMSSLGHVNLPNPLEWDIFLTTCSELKVEVLQSPVLTGDFAREFLSMPMPKFIWRAIAYDGPNPVIELIFDATAIIQGSFFLRAVEYDATLLRVLRNPGAINFADDDITRAIFTWFAEN